ncbi:MAG: hypothetical protein KAW12_26300 [Candidatus Aminicenantes bacterium]|nr:hypothetical protein [Candidatus Aminicenantes bacterium]
MIEEHDSKEIYCRILGHHLGFKYCRSAANGLPCRKLPDCWFEVFPVQAFMEKHFSKEEIDSVLAPPKPKLSSLLEAIKRAQES